MMSFGRNDFGLSNLSCCAQQTLYLLRYRKSPRVWEPR